MQSVQHKFDSMIPAPHPDKVTRGEVKRAVAAYKAAMQTAARLEQRRIQVDVWGVRELELERDIRRTLPAVPVRETLEV
jgi:hypothetical protein